jgi:hypothetical protein
MGKKVWFPTVSGPLAPHAAGLEAWLRSRSYSPSAVANRLCQLDQLSRWLEREVDLPRFGRHLGFAVNVSISFFYLSECLRTTERREMCNCESVSLGGVERLEVGR